MKKQQIDVVKPIDIPEFSDMNMSLKELKQYIDGMISQYGENSILKTDAGYNNVSFELLPEKLPKKEGSTTNKRTEITYDELKMLSFSNSKDLPSVINDGGRRKRWVGIGWVDEGEATGTEVKLI